MFVSIKVISHYIRSMQGSGFYAKLAPLPEVNYHSLALTPTKSSGTGAVKALGESSRNISACQSQNLNTRQRKDGGPVRLHGAPVHQSLR